MTDTESQTKPDGEAPESNGEVAKPGKVPKDSFVKDRLPFIVATGGEFLGLYFWLYFWDQGGTTAWVVATVVLWAGFLTERIAVLGWVKYFHGKMVLKYGVTPKGKTKTDLKAKPKAAAIAHLLFICFTEITIWVTFVLVYDRFGWVPAFAVLMIGEQLEHSMELGLIAQRPMREYIPSLNALYITLLEGIGGIAWLWLVRHGQPQVGGLILLIGLTIEHVVEGQAIKTDLEKPFAERKAEDEAKAKARAAESTSKDGSGTSPKDENETGTEGDAQ